jgi:putative Mg2+ transporter-C (MgtC) family protein
MTGDVNLSSVFFGIALMGIALALGWTVGYERHYSGRAAGSQVYCLVCVTSCAITQLDGTLGGTTHFIGSILTGIGFLGAGLIVQTGPNVRGLTTAAAIWGSSAIGILVGAHQFLPAIGLTALFIFSMAVVPRIEHRLPARRAMAATLRFRAGYKPRTSEIHRFLAERGLSIPPDSLTITHDGVHFELQCLIVADSLARSEAVNRIAVEMVEMTEIEGFKVTHSSRA